MADKKQGFDVRTVEKKMAAGVISRDDYKKALSEIPDSNDNAEFVPVDGEEEQQSE